MKNKTARKLKQVPTGYLTIGIDPHKKKHAAVAITEDLAVRTKFKFNNSRAGFEQALANARDEMTKASCRGVIFAIETGGHYWRNFALAYCAPATSPRPGFPKKYMQTFVILIALTSDW